MEAEISLREQANASKIEVESKYIIVMVWSFVCDC